MSSLTLAVEQPRAGRLDSRTRTVSCEPGSVVDLWTMPGAAMVIQFSARERGVATAVYIEEMFATGHDEANRAVFREHGPDEDNVVGIAMRAEKRLIDKITKGARMHG